MEEIDEDILVDILSRLPARPLGQLKSTNKRWYRLISDPYFVKLHLERSKKDTTGARQKVLKVSNRFCWKQQGIDTEFVGFKLFESGGQEMAIPYHRDPITWPFQPLKSVKIGGSCDGLICLVIHSGHRPTIRLWNPTTSEYRELPNVCHRREPNPVHEYWHSSIFGLGYDSGADDYKEVMMPEVDTEFPGLGILDGCLCIYTARFDLPWNGHFEAWTMKEYGAKKSWAKMISISMIEPPCVNIVQFLSLRNGKVHLAGCTADRTLTVLYDKDKGVGPLLLNNDYHFSDNNNWSYFLSTVCEESLVSPYRGAGVTERAGGNEGR
ncbi:uncharacterized protein LOC116212075 [Punica granatum]|uniref:Uncharacterized protein LOC116212075 n=1 Tax=Punica granatum TaxID=22663 RepID=A0A6P8DY98_PUNGR|nr:uncharacterized protein LOC116212075 [Punica granatum]